MNTVFFRRVSSIFPALSQQNKTPPPEQSDFSRWAQFPPDQENLSSRGPSLRLFSFPHPGQPRPLSSENQFVIPGRSARSRVVSPGRLDRRLPSRPWKPFVSGYHQVVSPILTEVSSPPPHTHPSWSGTVPPQVLNPREIVWMRLALRVFLP